jgi:hypothetical protein
VPPFSGETPAAVKPLRPLLAALLLCCLGAGLAAQSSVKKSFQEQYKQVVEDALLTSAGDPAFWNKAREIVFGPRVPTTDTARAKAVFRADLKDAPVVGNRDQTITVPAHSRVTYHGKPFCLQHDVPAPGLNAPMWLIPSAALFPQEALGLAKSVLRYSANHPADQNIVQTILWAIRHADKTPLARLAPAQEALLNAALPEGANQYYAFVRRLKSLDARETQASAATSNDIIVSSTDDGTSSGTSLSFEQIKQKVAQNNLVNAGIITHGNLNPYNPADVSGVLDQLTHAAESSPRAPSMAASLVDTGIATDGAQSLETDETNTLQGLPQSVSSSDSARVPEDDGYTLINEAVAVRVHTTLLAESKVEIANNSNTPYKFDPADFVGMAKPVSQPAYITPPPKAIASGEETDAGLATTGSQQNADLGSRAGFSGRGPTITSISGLASSSALPVTSDMRFAEENLDYALLSNAAYNTEYTPINGWEEFVPETPSSINFTTDHRIQFLIPSETFAQSTPSQAPLPSQAPSSRLYARTYRKGAEIVIAFCGTKWTHLDDWMTDISAFTMFGYPEQYAQALVFVEQVVRAKPANVTKITLTGHSLGGGLASFAALSQVAKAGLPSNLEMKAVSFNAAPVGLRLRLSIARAIGQQYVLVRAIDLEGDPVSALALAQGQQLGTVHWLKRPTRAQWVTDSSNQVADTTPAVVGPNATDLLTNHSMDTVIESLNEYRSGLLGH